jgi:3-phenylpropionate/trans-cinnamate dioxygenase ferredoxin subunit
MARERQRFKVGGSSDFAVARMQFADLDGRDVGIIRLRSGELRAIMNRCPHKGAPICKGMVGGVWESSGPGDITHDQSREVLVCPWHGFEFDLKTGKEVFWNRPASLRMYSIEELDGEVFVLV